MSDKQKRIVALLRKRGELGISKEQAKKYANEIEILTNEQFNKLINIAWDNNCMGTTCYKFLSDINK